MLPDLNDEIRSRVSGITYPAYVYSRQSAGELLEGDTGQGGSVFVGFSLATTVQAIIPAGAHWRVNDEVDWNGQVYVVSGVALRRDMSGEDHHITLTLDRPA